MINTCIFATSPFLHHKPACKAIYLSKKISKFCITGPLWGIPSWLVDSPNKGSVIWTACPCHNTIMYASVNKTIVGEGKNIYNNIPGKLSPNWCASLHKMHLHLLFTSHCLGHETMVCYKCLLCSYVAVILGYWGISLQNLTQYSGIILYHQVINSHGVDKVGLIDLYF